MKILIIHGDDAETSYKRLKEVIEKSKNKNYKIIYFNDRLNLEEIITNPSLFEEKRIVVIENYKNVNKKDINFLINNLNKYESNVIIYDKGIIELKSLKYFKKYAKTEEYKLPKTIYKFLDSFIPGNSKHCLKLFHNLIEKDNIEYVFAILVKHIKDLYIVKKDVNYLSYPFWRIQKLKYQSSKYSEIKLEKIIEILATIDVDSKTSKMKLVDSLDLLIASELE